MEGLVLRVTSKGFNGRNSLLRVILKKTHKGKPLKNLFLTVMKMTGRSPRYESPVTTII